MFACAIAHKDRRIGYFATTHAQAKDIAWKRLKEISEGAWAKEPNETLLELHINTVDGGTSEIVLRSWESVEKSRGTQFDLIVLDEVAKMRNFQDGWNGALIGTLAFREGKALFVSTPWGFNHFHDLYKLGQTNNPLYKSWRFTSFDNPFLSSDYLQGIQANSTEDFWQQEYLADFRRFTGLIYKEFDVTQHVHDFDHSFNEYGEYIAGQDFAVRGNNALIPMIMKSDGNVYILDNYKKDNLTSDIHGADMREMLMKYAPLEKYTIYGDPAGWITTQESKDSFSKRMHWSLADEYLEQGLPLIRGNNEVTAGINYVRQLFRLNKIHIHPRCTQLIDELLQYQWAEQSKASIGNKDAPEIVRKVNDHLVDSLRYALFSKPTAPQEQVPFTRGLPIMFKPPMIEETQDSDKLTPLDVPSVI